MSRSFFRCLFFFCFVVLLSLVRHLWKNISSNNIFPICPHGGAPLIHTCTHAAVEWLPTHESEERVYIFWGWFSVGDRMRYVWVDIWTLQVCKIPLLLHTHTLSDHFLYANISTILYHMRSSFWSCQLGDIIRLFCPNKWLYQAQWVC